MNNTSKATIPCRRANLPNWLGVVGKLKVNERGSKQNKIAEAESQLIDLVGNANCCLELLKVRADIVARVSTICKNFFALKFDSCK